MSNFDRLWPLFAVLAACGGASETPEAECDLVVVLANPGPPAGGCFVVLAGDSSTVRLAGTAGAGVDAIEVRRSEGYEQLACEGLLPGAPTLEPCAE